MLAVRTSPQQGPAPCLPNLLPCKIAHDGPVNGSSQLWSVKHDDAGVKTAYFRGRRLVGTQVAVPKDFQGMVLRKTNEELSAAHPQSASNGTDDGEDGEADDDTEQPEARGARTMQQIGQFDAITTWGHEAVLDQGQDLYSRGIQEWMSLARAIHRPDAPPAKSSASTNTP